MSHLNIANLPRVCCATLRQWMLNTMTSPSFAVIDVRDSDYIGGHIRGCHHTPVSTHPTSLPELARKLANTDVVIFHCMLCQQRGPKAALEYARTRERLLGPENGQCVVEGEEQGEGGKGQKVAYLEGGFAAWQRAGYGEDERITEGYDKRLWDEDMLD